jgi:hypothetical protein
MGFRSSHGIRQRQAMHSTPFHRVARRWGIPVDLQEREVGGLLNFHLHSPPQVLLFKRFFPGFCVSKVFVSL